MYRDSSDHSLYRCWMYRDSSDHSLYRCWMYRDSSDHSLDHSLYRCWMYRDSNSSDHFLYRDSSDHFLYRCWMYRDSSDHSLDSSDHSLCIGDIQLTFMPSFKRQILCLAFTEQTISASTSPSRPVGSISEYLTYADEETAAKKGVKKRKWNSKASKAGKTTKRTSSMEISSDVLKNLIGDVKLTETVFEMETEVVNTLDYDDQEEDQRDVRVKKALVSSPKKEERLEEEDARRVETRDASPESTAAIASEPEKKIIKLSSAAPKVAVKTKVKKSKSDKKDAVGKKEKKQDAVADAEPKEKVVATNRVIKPLMPVVDEPEPMTDRQSPARNPPDRVIRIAGLVRPFTVNQLKELLRRSGELDDEYFWISDIKSHCLAAYKTQEQAMAARAALHGTRWPQSNPKILFVDFATIDDVIHRKQEGKGPPPVLNKRPQEEPKIKEPKIVEKEEKKHKAKEPKEKGRVEREKEERDTKDRKRETEKKNFVREWDRDKIQQLSRSRSKSKDRDRPARRSRSREREQRKRGEYKDKREEERRKEKKQKDAKAEEEPPAKLLDDLFRKTKATPCIYWLPLTEEQAQVRMAKRLEEEKERQKKIAAAEEREKEELRKRETARLERQREREKAREKDRDRDRSKPERKASRSSSRSRSRRRR
ncbi:unnamed protein product [Candidula unifasciata]|uniref:Apoptotic chromatin condensation inducer in the nucleus n=1 Tax=Candidula unifasciata TaxID=100452 RepID=A0A8S3ZM85_9EUPU|nr:unnamed protein product [Candidula unifasciata]